MNGEGKLKVRGLQKGFQQTPLVEFKGTLDHLQVKPKDEWDRVLVEFGFTDVEVIQSTEPYEFPIAVINIKYSEKENSIWGIFAGSLANFLGPEEGVEELAASHARLHMLKTEGHEFGINRETGEPIIVSAWEVQDIEGREAGGTVKTPADRAMELLEGKTTQQWNQEVLADPVVKRDGTLITQILSRTFLPALEASGVIKSDESGIWHIVKEDASA